jgi:chemotaxis protein methyltransferase CheR
VSPPRISPALLREAEAAVEDLLGIAFAGPLARRIEEAVVRSAGELGLAPEALVSLLRARDARCAGPVIERTVVGETSFGRHPEQLAAIVSHVVHPEEPERPLRVWSAGCATGEEAYELAMALLAAGRRQGLDRIVATDASEHALAQARAARYGARSIRRLDPALRARFLSGTHPPFEVTPAVKALVELQRANLVCDAAPAGPFDLVLCRNVLIYFAPRAAAAVLRKLTAALRPGGFLALGPAEAPLAAGLPLEWVGNGSPVLLRRLAPEAEDRSRRRPAEPTARVAAYPGPDPARRRRRDGPPEARRPAPREAAVPAGAAEPARPARRGEAGPAALEISAAEAELLLALAAEARGELGKACSHLRRALYLAPKLAVAHASMASLQRRMGRQDEARRAGRNALRALEGVADGKLLPGVARLTAGALREALEQGGWAG